MARKKIVFVIVEGPSDYLALGSCLDKIFDKNTVHVEIVRCDITTEKGTSPANILNKICSFVKKYAANNSYTKIHFQQIIHIMDMDGAFVDDRMVVEKAGIKDLIYNSNNILCNNREKIIQRNKQKSSVINKLITAHSIWTIPYSAYFMSCNLDHVLYNIQNCDDDQKEVCARNFANNFKNNINGFKVFIAKSDFSIVGDYIASWEYIKTDTHSLERHTNLGLCFPQE